MRAVRRVPNAGPFGIMNRDYIVEPCWTSHRQPRDVASPEFDLRLFVELWFRGMNRVRHVVDI